MKARSEEEEGEDVPRAVAVVVCRERGMRLETGNAEEEGERKRTRCLYRSGNSQNRRMTRSFLACIFSLLHLLLLVNV